MLLHEYSVLCDSIDVILLYVFIAAALRTLCFLLLFEAQWMELLYYKGIFDFLLLGDKFSVYLADIY